MRFDVDPELKLFADSVRAAIADWQPVREPDLGSWLDDRDDELGARLAEVGWAELWTSDLAPVVAGGLALGRAVAPVCLVDEATLAAPLALGGRLRHGTGATSCALPLAGWGLAMGRPSGESTDERTLDGSGTVRVAIVDATPLEPGDAHAHWSAWTAATLAYLAGLAAAALDAAIEHARAREQFGRPLSAMPAIQARLADAAIAVDGLELTAWQAATPAVSNRTPALLWAGAACRDVTATAHQVHGAVGFALETGVHRYYRRAKAAQVWAAEVCPAATS